MLWELIGLMKVASIVVRVLRFARSMQSVGEVHVIDKETCIDCGACDDVCPVDVIKWEVTA